MPEAEARRPDPPISLLLRPKWLTARARALANERGRGARFFLLALIGMLFWVFIYTLLYKLLVYFRGVPDLGPFLAGKLLGMILIGFFSILLLSNVITALSSFFLARDLDLLVGAPVDWLKLYGAKLLETGVNSSWMVVLLAVPMFAAFGSAYHGGWLFPLLVIGVFVPFLMIPAVIGSAITLILVNVFPARRTRDILSVIAVLAAGGIVLLFRIVRPERLARPEGFRSLVEFVTVLRTPTSPFLPSEWVQRALLSPLGILRRELVLKELRLFFRDTTQWSQLILLTVLVIVYVFNIKYLPLKGEGVTFFLVNVIPFLNLVLAGFVLASVAARFIFPSVSLEGRTLWLLRSSPMPVQQLLWAKFWVGTTPLLVLALGIVFVTNWLLQVSDFMFAVSVMTISMMTIALCGMALGFGTLFPQFETENAAQIPTSFGGLMFMIASVGLIAGVVVLEARPVYSYLSARLYGTPTSMTEMAFGFGLAALLCVVATIVPIRIARRRLEAVER